MAECDKRRLKIFDALFSLALLICIDFCMFSCAVFCQYRSCDWLPPKMTYLVCRAGHSKTLLARNAELLMWLPVYQSETVRADLLSSTTRLKRTLH